MVYSLFRKQWGGEGYFVESSSNVVEIRYGNYIELLNMEEKNFVVDLAKLLQKSFRLFYDRSLAT